MTETCRRRCTRGPAGRGVLHRGRLYCAALRTKLVAEGGTFVPRCGSVQAAGRLAPGRQAGNRRHSTRGAQRDLGGIVLRNNSVISEPASPSGVGTAAYSYHYKFGPGFSSSDVTVVAQNGVQMVTVTLQNFPDDTDSQIGKAKGLAVRLLGKL